MRTNALIPERDCTCLVTTSGDLPQPRGEAAVQVKTDAPEFVARAFASTRTHTEMATPASRASKTKRTPPE